MRYPLFAALLLATSTLAGCLGGSNDAAEVQVPDDVAPESTTPAVGWLRGTVTNEEQQPLEDVLVTARLGTTTLQNRTDADGSFSIQITELGLYVLTYAVSGYLTATKDVAVTVLEAVDASTILVLPEEDQPYFLELQPIQGRYDCAVEVLIFPGDCMILWNAYLSEYAGNDTVTEEVAHFFVDVAPGWSHVVAELVWSEGANNQLEGLRFYLAPANESRAPTEHHTKIAVAEGAEQPLWIQVDAGEIHAAAERYPDSEVYAELPVDGGELIGLVYPRGKLADTFGEVCPEPDKPDRCFLGVGAGLNIEFTAYVAVFYNGEPVADGYTMIPEA